MPLSNTRIEQLAHFADVAVEQKWTEGTYASRSSMAFQLGWSEAILSHVVRAIKEYPEYGPSISTRRGPNPQTVVSVEGVRLQSESSLLVSMISEAKAKENFRRVVRDACTSFVAYKNSDKTTTGGRAMKPYRSRMKAFLMSLHAQASEDNDVYGIKDLVERALVEVGVRYDTDDE
jgi:hypothetical protein